MELGRAVSVSPVVVRMVPGFARLRRPRVARAWSAPSHRQLGVEFKALRAVGERPADPGLKARVIIGHVAASWKPCAEEPLECAQLQVEAAAHFNLGDDHRRKSESTDLSLRE